MTVSILNEEFTCSGKNTINNGWTELMPWKQIDAKEMPGLSVGDVLQIGTVKFYEIISLLNLHKLINLKR